MAEKQKLGLGDLFGPDKLNINLTIHLSPEVERLLRDHLKGIKAAIHKLETKLMADSASVLAKITANTDLLRSVALTVDALNEGQDTIVALIADLKAQIAAGQPTDFTEIEAALDDQGNVIAGAQAAIGANT